MRSKTSFSVGLLPVGSRRPQAAASTREVFKFHPQMRGGAGAPPTAPAGSRLTGTRTTGSPCSKQRATSVRFRVPVASGRQPMLTTSGAATTTVAAISRQRATAATAESHPQKATPASGSYEQ
ncbi:HNH endonuclease [Mycobacterium phage Ulysses]|nr:HNH endonuclease [Mycobacterium phage Ulysses]